MNIYYGFLLAYRTMKNTTGPFIKWLFFPLYWALAMTALEALKTITVDEVLSEHTLPTGDIREDK